MIDGVYKAIFPILFDFVRFSQDEMLQISDFFEPIVIFLFTNSLATLVKSQHEIHLVNEYFKHTVVSIRPPVQRKMNCISISCKKDDDVTLV